MLSVKDINLLQAQNEGLKKQNAELQKENAILKEENYNKLIAWEEMQAENDRLKEEIKEVKKYQYEQEFLEKEIEELKEKNEKIIVGYIKLSERYKHTLQAIKAIVCGNYEIIDPQGRKDILKLITKAEEE